MAKPALAPTPRVVTMSVEGRTVELDSSEFADIWQLLIESGFKLADEARSHTEQGNVVTASHLLAVAQRRAKLGDRLYTARFGEVCRG